MPRATPLASPIPPAITSSPAARLAPRPAPSLASLVLGLLLVALPAGTEAQCDASPGAAWSISQRLSPRAGRACLIDVTVHRGGTCGEPLWFAELGCGEARRVRVTDDGRLVSLLTPRVARPAWEIVRVRSLRDGRVRLRSVRFEDLPGVSGARGERPALRFEDEGVRVETTPAVLVPYAALDAAGRERRGIGGPVRSRPDG